MDDIDDRVTLVNKCHDSIQGRVYLLFQTQGEELRSDGGLGLIAYSVKIFGIDATEAIKSALNIVKRDSHITISRENGGIHTGLIVVDFFRFKDALQTSGNLVTCESPKADNCASALDGLNNL